MTAIVVVLALIVVIGVVLLAHRLARFDPYGERQIKNESMDGKTDE